MRWRERIAQECFEPNVEDENVKSEVMRSCQSEFGGNKSQFEVSTEVGDEGRRRGMVAAEGGGDSGRNKGDENRKIHAK